MMQLEEEKTHKKLTEINHFHFHLANIPTKVLYNFQVSVEQEVQSRSSENAIELQTDKDINNTLNITLKGI